MKPTKSDILKNILGDDIFDVLKKYEIYKPESKTALSPDEIKVALQIVPRTILNVLFAELKWLDKNESKDVDLNFLCSDSKLHVTKHVKDNYSGEIVRMNE